MVKFRIKVGWTAYQLYAGATAYIGGAGICDDCGHDVLHDSYSVGYLVPVLNHFMCLKCFMEWMERTKYYPEDADFEYEMIEYYEKFFPLMFDLSPFWRKL